MWSMHNPSTLVNVHPSPSTVFNLYNSVSYNNANIEVLKTDIDNMINTQCTQSIHVPMVPIVLLEVMYYQLFET